MLKGFDPIISTDPKILILGSMPSVTSLEKQEYYGFAHNRFWKIMQELYNMPITTYEEKKSIIYQHHMIVWDIIGECEREGSLDSHIRMEKINDITGLLQNYPSIKRILCNGKKSFTLFQKHFGTCGVEYCYVPSTSNANRSINEEALYHAWRMALITDTN